MSDPTNEELLAELADVPVVGTGPSPSVFLDNPTDEELMAELVGVETSINGQLIVGDPPMIRDESYDGPRVSRDEAAARVTICMGCDRLESGLFCTECVCGVLSRANIPNQTCPIGKW